MDNVNFTCHQVRDFFLKYLATPHVVPYLLTFTSVFVRRMRMPKLSPFQIELERVPFDPIFFKDFTIGIGKQF